MNRPFEFKRFSVQQDKCAMKIGTDGVLLGAWASIDKHPNSILDIGTGTGIIALQLAQRSDAAVIDAIEKNADAFEQAVLNFENSEWSDRLYCYHASLAEFSSEIDDRYELIVSNPPFYTSTFETNDRARNTARFSSALPTDMLVNSVSKLLDKNGVFALILPYKEEDNFVELAMKKELYLNRKCEVPGAKSG